MKINYKKLILLFCAIIVCIFAAILFLKKSKSKTDKKYVLNDFAMGTAISIELYGNDEKLEQATRDISERIKQLDEKVISWRISDSEIANINNSYEVGKKYNMSDDLALALTKSYDLCKDTGGALDITIRNLANLWNIENATEDNFVIPTADEIKDILDNRTGYENIEISANAVTINKPDLILDLGAVGKGYALDYVKDYIESSQIKGAVISVGGSVYVYGSKPDNDEWRIGIRNPKSGRNDMLGYVVLKPNSNMCISTSGDYEKYIEFDGKIYHHILDRNTGYPADGELSSVTIICEDGLVSDGLSTACFILGSERSKAVIEKYNASAIFVDKDNNVEIIGNVDFVQN